MLAQVRAGAVIALGLTAADAGVASAQLWGTSVATTNTVVSQPVAGGGYPVPPGQTAPDPGTCRVG